MIIADTGPLVAYLHPREPNHHWAVTTINTLPTPFLTCDAVLTETLFFASKHPNGIDNVFRLLNRGVLQLDFNLNHHLRAIQQLMLKYRDLPMALADACMVRLSELHPHAHILTIDSHFRIYRRNSHDAIPVIMPA